MPAAATRSPTLAPDFLFRVRSCARAHFFSLWGSSDPVSALAPSKLSMHPRYHRRPGRHPETGSLAPTPTASESEAPALQGLFCWLGEQRDAVQSGKGLSPAPDTRCDARATGPLRHHRRPSIPSLRSTLREGGPPGWARPVTVARRSRPRQWPRGRHGRQVVGLCRRGWARWQRGAKRQAVCTEGRAGRQHPPAGNPDFGHRKPIPNADIWLQISGVTDTPP